MEKCIKNVFLKFTMGENQKWASGSKFEWATSIGTPSRKSKVFNRELADCTVGVAPNRYPRPISSLLGIFNRGISVPSFWFHSSLRVLNFVFPKLAT